MKAGMSIWQDFGGGRCRTILDGARSEKLSVGRKNIELPRNLGLPSVALYVGHFRIVAAKLTLSLSLSLSV